MKSTLFSLLLLLIGFTSAFAQNDNSVYNADLARELGADDYGMKSYVLAILKTGPNTEATPEERTALFRGHMQNMGRLASEKALLLAGPLGANDMTFRGIFVLNTDNLDQAREWVNTDPAVEAGIFEVLLIPYYGSAMLQQLNDLHATIQKTGF